jgi:16S rRNA (uracil1498-N3)-methyltransferase
MAQLPVRDAHDLTVAVQDYAKAIYTLESRDGAASTTDLAALVAEADLAVVLHEDATGPLSAVDVPATGRILVVVGPEGGIAPDELSALADAGARSVRLGAEVLRTSTAGGVAVAALLARTDRWA